MRTKKTWHLPANNAVWENLERPPATCVAYLCVMRLCMEVARHHPAPECADVLTKIEVDKYLLWLYRKGSIVLFSNGHGNSFYDKDKNTDKNIENIYLIRLKKDFIDKINKSLKIIDKKEKYRIIYNDKKRYLYINNLYITKFTFDKTNDRLMSFLIKNPNKKYTKIELQKRIAKINRLQSFKIGDLQTKIIQIGFKKDTLKAFFDISSTSIIFHNPVYESRLKDLEIEHLSITQIK